MTRALPVALTLAVSVLASNAAAGGDYCPAYAADQWMSEEAVEARFLELGYTDPRGIKPEHGCWEVKGKDSDGNRVEIYLDPVTGAVAKIKG